MEITFLINNLILLQHYQPKTSVTCCQRCCSGPYKSVIGKNELHWMDKVVDDRSVDELVSGWINGWMSESMGGWMDAWMYGWMHKVVDGRSVDESVSGRMLNRKQTQTHVVRHRAAAGLFFSETLKAVNIQQPFTRRQTARGDEGGGGYKSRVYGLSMDQ